MTENRLAAGLFYTDSATGSAAGPPLVLIHGAGGTHRSWPDELRTLPGRRVIALDLPGHGDSPGPGCSSIPAYARSVAGLLDALGLASAVIAGHSMGGAIALTLALETPARVAGLILAGTGARLRVAPAILEATADPTTFSQAADLIAEWSFGKRAGPALRQEFAAAMVAGAPQVAHGDFTACDGFDVRERLGAIQAAALVVCGTDDALTPPKYSEYLRDHLARAQLELVPGAGHMVMLEAPAEVAAAVESFLQQTSPGGRMVGGT